MSFFFLLCFLGLYDFEIYDGTLGEDAEWSGIVFLFSYHYLWLGFVFCLGKMEGGFSGYFCWSE